MKYLVWNPQGRMPRHQHDDYISALHEAKRLAQKELLPMYVIELRAMVRPQYSYTVVSFEKEEK